MTHLHPFLNACLNATSALLLLAGYAQIMRGRRVSAHKTLMLGAFAMSSIFLTSYVARFLLTGATRYPATDWTRTAYFVLLGTHSLLAMAVLPFVLRTLFLAWKSRFAEHAKLARWVFPVWLYVSTTGVLVYWMLYHFGPARAAS